MMAEQNADSTNIRDVISVSEKEPAATDRPEFRIHMPRPKGTDGTAGRRWGNGPKPLIDDSSVEAGGVGDTPVWGSCSVYGGDQACTSPR